MTSDIELVDLLVVGGGVNGVGVARDAAGRGLKVALCEQGDLAGATSSASSKLIHGGLRYLEHYQFALVRESLNERTRLLNNAPHIVHPIRFVLPHARDMRPAWMMSIGLFLYDHLGANHPRLVKSRRLDLARAPEGLPLSNAHGAGFSYSDCTVDDARLVILNAVGAAERGAQILTRTALVNAQRDHGAWRVELRDTVSGAIRTMRARTLVNAAGPWARHVLDAAHGDAGGRNVRPVKGSHIIVPRLYDGDHAYTLQNNDGRVVFAIPYQGRFTLIGTTEVELPAPPPLDNGALAISPAETDYLCRAANRFFQAQITPDDVVGSFAGVRPLFKDRAQSTTTASREYVLDLQDMENSAPLLSVFGGKITTYRRLSEKVVDRLAPYLPTLGPAWTEDAPLPGGDLPAGGLDALAATLHAAYPWAQAPFVHGLMTRHGTRASQVWGDASSPDDLGTDFGHGLTAREVDYFKNHEWARTAEDVLWRRTKLGLVMSRVQQAALATYLA